MTTGGWPPVERQPETMVHIETTGFNITPPASISPASYAPNKKAPIIGGTALENESTTSNNYALAPTPIEVADP